MDLLQRCSPFLRFLRLFAANPTGCPQCAPPRGPNITGIQRILEMIREGTRTGCLPNCGHFIRELEVFSLSTAGA